MRVVVKIPARAYAELLADLELVPPRERAERMRVLASVGLTVIRCAGEFARLGAASVSQASGAVVETGHCPGPEKTAGAGFFRIHDRLKGGMET